MEAPVKSHRFQFTLSQTSGRNDNFLDVNLNDFALKIGSQASRFRFADDSTLLEDGSRNPHFLEELIEGCKGIARGKGHECGRIGNDQHQAFARKADNSESRSPTG